MKFERVFAVFAALMFAMLWAAPASAQATRTWVSGVGDDANPCSRTAPCKTWAGAIAKTVPGGEIDALDPGGFGALTITKSITLDGGGGQVASVLVAGTNGITVAGASTDRIIIRNLRFDGLNTAASTGNGTGSPGLCGISFLTGTSLVLEHDVIMGFQTAGVCFQPSGASKLYMRDVAIDDTIGSGPTNGYGILVNPGSAGGAGGEFDDVSVLGNSNAGLEVQSTGGAANLVVTKSTFAGNGTYGIQASSTSAVYVMVTGSTITNSNTAGVDADAGGSATIQIGQSTVSRNNIGLQNTGGTLQSFGDNYVTGNITNTSGVIGGVSKQ